MTKIILSIILSIITLGFFGTALMAGLAAGRSDEPSSGVPTGFVGFGLAGCISLGLTVAEIVWGH